MKIQLLIEGESTDEDIKSLIAHLHGAAPAAKAAGASKAPVKPLEPKAPAATDTTEEGEITLDSIRALFVAKAGAGKKKAECAALLKKYKTTSITDLDTKHYAAFTEDLNAL